LLAKRKVFERVVLTPEWSLEGKLLFEIRNWVFK